MQAERGDGGLEALSWLRSALWAPEADVALVPVDRADPRATWLARPAAGAPELLVPLASRRAAAAVSRRFWDGMPVSRRARQWVGEVALRTGLAQRWWPGRVALVGADPELDDPERSLLARLAIRLGEGRVLAAVTLRPAHYNAKPVLALFDAAGRLLAFAKVAVDEVSDEYVRTEIEWLARAANAPAPLRAPRLIGAESWRGHPVALLEPLVLPRVPRHRADGALEALAEAVLALGPVERVTVERAGIVARARAEAATGAGVAFAELIDAVVEHHAGEVLDVGPWHGDLSPWNTATGRGEVLVWDWELAGEGMPVGSDLRHRAVMVATHLAARSARETLDALPARDPAVALYLLELARRDRRARRSGRADEFARMGDAAVGRLRRELRP